MTESDVIEFIAETLRELPPRATSLDSLNATRIPVARMLHADRLVVVRALESLIRADIRAGEYKQAADVRKAVLFYLALDIAVELGIREVQTAVRDALLDVREGRKLLPIYAESIEIALRRLQGP